jgi:hypothetical protein
MVIMPTDDVILIGIGFLGYAVIHNHNSLFTLNLSHMGFDPGSFDCQR